MAKASILIVEDEPVIALDIQHQLLSLGYEVSAIADSAETALAAVDHCLPDLVFMDIHIRGQHNGIETADCLREQYNLPIVFLTAHADSVTLDQAKATCPFGYITKPFDTHNLSTTVEIALSRYQAEQKMRTALQREKEVNELKSQFISIVSHEFRNPLSSILFSLDLLERHNHQLTAEKKQLYFQRARDSVGRMRALLEEVLVIGEAEAGKLTCHPEPLPLVGFCQGLMEDLQTTASNHHQLTLGLDRWTAAPGTYHLLDSKLLHHILSNLLSNAIKYSPEGGQVSLKIVNTEDRVTFYVQDQGIGIPLDDQPHLFKNFHRAANVSTIPGTGLGLSIVKQCTEAHGGQIAIQSEPGIGTTFIVTLPCQSVKSD